MYTKCIIKDKYKFHDVRFMMKQEIEIGTQITIFIFICKYFQMTLYFNASHKSQHLYQRYIECRVFCMEVDSFKITSLKQ